MKKEPEEAKEITLQQETSAEYLIGQAIQKNVPVETMERLLAMRKELKQERAKEDYDKAMAAFQAECPTIKKTRQVKTSGGVVAYSYAPIESIVLQVKDILQKNGFSYSTGMELKENGVRVTCRVTHAGGHSEESSMEVPFGNKTNVMSQTQVVAAAQTFAKRYAFCNSFGILTGDEDTDAKPVEEKKTEEDNEQECYEKAKKMITASENIDMLIQFCERVRKGQSSYTKEHENELTQLAVLRVGKLENHD